LQDDRDVLKRTVMWQPFIVDWWDTRLQPHQPRDDTLDLDTAQMPTASAVEAVVSYRSLDEARRSIGCQNAEPVSYEVYRARIVLAPQPRMPSLCTYAVHGLKKLPVDSARTHYNNPHPLRVWPCKFFLTSAL
jgi:hypothetical protein